MLFSAVEDIVNSLVIDGKDEEERAKRREDIRRMLMARRQRAEYFGTVAGTAVGVPEFDVQLKPEYASGEKPGINIGCRPMSDEQGKALRGTMDELIQARKLGPAPQQASFGSPHVLVRKSDGQ